MEHARVPNKTCTLQPGAVAWTGSLFPQKSRSQRYTWQTDWMAGAHASSLHADTADSISVPCQQLSNDLATVQWRGPDRQGMVHGVRVHVHVRKVSWFVTWHHTLLVRGAPEVQGEGHECYDISRGLVLVVVAVQFRQLAQLASHCSSMQTDDAVLLRALSTHSSSVKRQTL